jgi:serine/threonine protein phosphatase PrpC
MYKMLTEADTAAILASKRASPRWAQSDLQEMVAALIKASNAAGGRDNVTVVIVGVRDAARA